MTSLDAFARYRAAYLASRLALAQAVQHGRAGDEAAAKRLMPVRARLSTAARDALTQLHDAIVAEGYSDPRGSL